MKTKQTKEELDKNEDETTTEPKTRARKKASDIAEEEKNKTNQDDSKPSKEPRKNVGKPKAVVKKKPLGIRKALRSKRALAKDKIKSAVTHTITRARKAAIKTEPDNSQEKETVPLIPASEIKKEPVDDTTPGSRSSSPKTAGRRQRLSSDMVMMKSMLGDCPSSLVLGPRTSPYSMRSERSNSPSLSSEGKKRTMKPRKAKSNLLNEVVMKEQNKKRRRLLSDSKTTDSADVSEDCKKLKRGRSCSRDGSEISKCSDITESDLSMSESLNDVDNKELNKKLDKPKTELDIDIQNNVQISTVKKVPSLNVDSKLETKLDVDTSCTVNDKNKKKMSLQRSTSLDSDNNNSNRLKLESLHSSDIEDKSSMKTENDTLFAARSSILTSMSKTFNSKEVSKNIRKARRGRKAAANRRPSASPASKNDSNVANSDTSATEEKQETLESLSKEIDDLINNLDQNIDGDHEVVNDPKTIDKTDSQTKTVSKFYSLSKPLGDNNSIVTPETPIKDKDSQLSITNESTPSKVDDSENIQLHYEEDSIDKADGTKQDKTYKCSTVASIDLLMDRLKEFEEFDKRRQRQESESKSNEAKSVMVSNDVVLIPKSGADIKLKDIQTVRSPERPIEKENVLSCFENNSAISIVKRDHVRKSIDIDLPSSVTLIKRNSFSARKESTSSNHSREADAISIFEKSLGKDVTLTEIRKSVDKQPTTPTTTVDLHQFATLHPNNPTQSIAGVTLDPNQISIMPRVISEPKIISSEVQITKRNSRESISRKLSESANEPEEKMATIEKIKSPLHQVLSSAISITPTPVAIKSPESIQPIETEALAPPLECVKVIPDNITLTSDISKVTEASVPTLDDTANKLAGEKAIDKVAEEKIFSKIAEEKENIKVDKEEETTKVAEEKEIAEEVEEKEMTQEAEDKLLADDFEDLQETKVNDIENVTQAMDETMLEIEPKSLAVESIKQVVEPNKQVAEPNKQVAELTKLVTESTKQVVEPIRQIIEPTKIVTEATRQATEPTIQVTEPLKQITEPTTEVTESTKQVTGPTKQVIGPVQVTEPTKPDIVTKEIKMDVDEKQNLKCEPLKEVLDEPKKSETAEKVKTSRGSKSARNSVESQPGPSNVLQETPESQRRKENILRTLGLLTHKAAKEAKIEKLKEKERLYNGLMSKKQAVKSGDYTGTLKTVIKLNRGTGERDKKRQRSSLKMTFQKSKNRAGKPQLEQGEETRDDDAYYTIERREAVAGASSDETEAVPEPVEPKETLNLVIPEKASSFSIHPGRLCMDQCFYCGGKFGLFDTPCHIAQMKSAERQKKVLDNEEKLTIDSCLCDACYRHVDRRANCPSYRKRPALRQPHPAAATAAPSPTAPPSTPALQQPEKPPSPLEDESEEESHAGLGARCHTAGCGQPASHSIRRKWLIKMRTSVNKILRLEGDYPGLHTIPLCAAHYAQLGPLLACRLCARRVTRHHNAHLLHSYEEVNPLLSMAGIPVQFTERPILCKMCRYYCTLLLKPTNEKYARAHRRKLLQIHNIEVPPESDHETEDPGQLEDTNGNAGKPKKKARTKSKQRKSTEPEKPSENESSEKTESSPEKSQENTQEDTEAQKTAPPNTQPLEEDIESLISSNKIPVPGAKFDAPQQSDSSEDNVFDFENPILPVDKQTELQYLLQKQNNPAQFLHKTPNLTQKQRNPSKVQNTGIQKIGQQLRINDKNAKRIQKLGQVITQKEKPAPREDGEMSDGDKSKDNNAQVLKNIPLSDECTIESIPNKRPPDITTLKSKWQMSESFTQVKRNLSELSKKFTVEKDPKKTTEVKYFNPVKRLETNPSISVRELFPGEEEMNLQCNIEFNSVKGVTPEGWEKCNSVIQYDSETKKLWTELQRPYGNQSSFLRHLILLEKYFRSGDLVLSHNATPHAANYSDSVQSRLRAYDNVASDAPRRSEPAINLIEYRKKPAVNGKSLLKSNQNDTDKDLKKFMPPPGSVPKKLAKDKGKAKPPELIAINSPNQQGRKAIQNVLHNIQQLVKGVSASDPTEVAAAPLPVPKFDPPKPDQPKETPIKKDPPKPDTPKKTKLTSKPWRPTLMPITQENLAKIAREPTQVAVDGRQLPSLVQVISSGKRYHITLQDYNKMCIMRKEKLQQLQDGDKTKKPEETSVVTEIQTSAMLGNGGTLVQTIPAEKEHEKKEMPELSQISSNAATILKNVGLKNITIAPIPPKTATVTSLMTAAPLVSSPSLIVTTTPMKLPHLGPSVSITSETIVTPALPVMSSGVLLPKIPKSLTVIPQGAVLVPQSPTAPLMLPTSDGPRP